MPHKQIGVIMETGPQDWQILQQHNGCANIALSGRYDPLDKKPPYRVWTRIVREASGEPVIGWTPARTGEDKSWSTVLEGVPAGGLYRLETCLKEDATLYFDDSLRGDLRHHIGVGDLYLIAGQSNAAGFARDYVSDEPQLGVHVYKTSGRWDLASHPLNDSTDTIRPANREPVMAGHSPFLHFGKYLKRELGYPIGLIPAALGGSALDEWLPGPKGALYDNMMKILQSLHGEIQGVLWYQGCTDASDNGYTDLEAGCRDYLARFTRFVSLVRGAAGWDVPFYTVQLNRRRDQSAPEWDVGWSAVRQAQRQAARLLENVYITPAWDGMMSDVIHNSAGFNLILGERLAKLALAKTYGRAFACDAPDFAGAVVDGDRLCITFAPVYDRLDTYEVPPSGLPLRIEDEKGAVPIETYTLERDALSIQLARVPEGRCFVSCAWGSDPQGIPMIDFGTHYPVLAFCRQEATRN